MTTQIVVAVPVGIALGCALPGFSTHLAIISELFIRLVQMAVVPLIVSVLVSGIRIGKARRFGWKHRCNLHLVHGPYRHRFGPRYARRGPGKARLKCRAFTGSRNCIDFLQTASRNRVLVLDDSFECFRSNGAR